MTARHFVDTNILLYASSNAADDSLKRSIAHEVLRLGSLGFSTQVIQEYYYSACRKKRLLISDSEALDTIEKLLKLTVVTVSPALILLAIHIRKRFQISYWDAAIIAAAQELGCGLLYSEDLSHGQEYGGVKVINPFL